VTLERYAVDAVDGVIEDFVEEVNNA